MDIVGKTFLCKDDDYRVDKTLIQWYTVHSRNRLLAGNH